MGWEYKQKLKCKKKYILNFSISFFSFFYKKRIFDRMQHNHLILSKSSMILRSTWCGPYLYCVVSCNKKTGQDRTGQVGEDNYVCMIMSRTEIEIWECDWDWDWDWMWMWKTDKGNWNWNLSLKKTLPDWLRRRITFSYLYILLFMLLSHHTYIICHAQPHLSSSVLQQRRRSTTLLQCIEIKKTYNP